MLKAKYLGVVLLLAISMTVSAQQQTDQHHHQDRKDGVNQRGDHAMGFSHEKTTHHFSLSTEGGAIEVTANDSSDTASIEQIRTHLAHIAALFKEGDFSMPMFIHADTPPGVPAMKRLKSEINYQFETIDRGALVRISTKNAEAIEAIHAFLRYQIKDHQTGDPLEIEKKPGI